MPSSAAAPIAVPGLRRNMVTICAMTATIMQALDTTIANVALPYMQGTLSASQDQINWVLTSYIVAAAIMTAPVGWIANRFGRKRIFILCSGGFTVASVLCGLAQDINQMVLFRLLQGMFGAALVPLSQAVMLDSYALHERAKAMSIWGMGVMMGPIMGPSLGAWLTETYSWHWVFFVNLPFGIFTVLGLMVFMDETRKNRELRFDWFGFAALAVGIGALQIALDRGEQLGWLESNEIIAEFIVSIVGFYYFFAHSLTTANAVHPVCDLQGQELRRRLRVHGGHGAGAVLDHGDVVAVPAERDRLSDHHRRPAAGDTRLRHLRRHDAGRPADALYRGAHADHLRSQPDLSFAVLHDRLDRSDRRSGDRRRQHRAGIRVRPGVRAAEHGGVPDAAQPSAHRRHLDADPDAQRRQLDRHFHRHRAADRGIAARLCGAVAARQSVQPCHADAGRARHDRHGHRQRPRHGGRDGQAAGADHRLFAGLPDGDDLHAVRDSAGDHDRLDQGRAAQAVDRRNMR